MAIYRKKENNDMDTLARLRVEMLCEQEDYPPEFRQR